MILERFEAAGLAHYSYLLSSQGQAIVIDPQRDIDGYLRWARRRHARITHVLETHIHADYASGARELAAVTGAELCLSAYDAGETFAVQYPHRPLRDQEEIAIGNLVVVAIHTPGHTPEHLSFLVYEKTRCGQPMALFTGDFIFTGSIGRPDLLGDDAKLALAEAMYDSIHSRIRQLPDFVEIYPAHGAGSLCGTAISERPHSTLGYERYCNIFLADKDRPHFVRHLLETVPNFPPYYRRMKQLNSDGPSLLGSIPGSDPLPELPANALVIDLRRPESFGGAHIPGALSLGRGSAFGLWAGRLIPPGRPLVVVADDDAEDARRMLTRVGLDDIRGWMTMDDWIASGRAIDQVPQVREPEGTVLDVRTAGEFAGGHLDGAISIPLEELTDRIGEVPPGPLTVVCGSGYRASAAASLLKPVGLNPANLAGGMNAWRRTHSPS